MHKEPDNFGGSALAGDSDPAEMPTMTTHMPRAGQPASPRMHEQAWLLEPGAMIGRYQVVRALARGGMGQVFLARDARLGRKVAIKFVRSEARERFLVEAQLTAQLQHENIVVIHEVDVYEDMPYMVLEYLDGEPLSSLLAQGPVAPGRAVELMIPVVRALICAHAAGIVHRDLKPANILLTNAGTVKVLDFGIAQPAAVIERESGRLKRTHAHSLDSPSTSHGTATRQAEGTLAYMSPEQFEGDVDSRTDLFSVGITLHRLLTGRHPVDPLSKTSLLRALQDDIDVPFPSVAEILPALPPQLAKIVDRCLMKRAADRYGSARELLDELETLLPGRARRGLGEQESPYPGLVAFQEANADRFFGRQADIARAVALLREQPIAAVVGPSGAGKSSFLRAGVVPALKASGEAWEVISLRPGRSPMVALCRALFPFSRTSHSGHHEIEGDEVKLVERLREEPGYLGMALRARAQEQSFRVLLLVDQFEELFTLCPDRDEREAFLSCLAGAADDVSGPVRLVLSMRADFLDRLSDHRSFLENVASSLFFLGPPERHALREALLEPASLAGYEFEDPAIVDEIINALESTSGSLSILQFAALRLWEMRDRQRKCLTRAAYQAMGGVAGALAKHADQVLGGFSPTQRRLARSLFQRLVTPEGTRTVIDLAELRELSHDTAEVDDLVDTLVAARLLLVEGAGGGAGDDATVEIVHESLITAWPTLRRWLDEGHEETAFLAQLRDAARQWDRRDRSRGLLWRAEALDDARRFCDRYALKLARREREFLDAAFALATRGARIRRAAIVGALVFLTGLVGAGAVALVAIRNAEQQAQAQAALAVDEAARAQAAERQVHDQLSVIQAKESELERALESAKTANAGLTQSKEQLEQTNDALLGASAKLEAALAAANAAARRAEEANDAERQVRRQLEIALEGERERVRELERERQKIATELK